MALKFFWNCEAADFSADNAFDAPYTGTCYSAGDDVAALQSAAQINTDAARIGTNGLDCPTSSDAALFDVSTNDIVNPALGSIAVSFRMVAWANGATIFKVNGTDSGGDYFALEMIGTDDATGRELRFRYRSTAGAAENRAIETSAANLAENTWYAAVVRWDTASDLMKLEVYDNAGGPITEVSGTETITTLSTCTQVYWGEQGTVASDIHIDNCFIADTYAEALQNKLTITAYSEYSPTANLGAKLLLLGIG